MTTTRKLVLSEQASLIEQVQRIAEGSARCSRRSPRSWFTTCARRSTRSSRSTTTCRGAPSAIPRPSFGLARIADDDFPPVLANYPNRFADGRTAKSTSIGIKDSTGRYVAALCLNADVTLFRGFQAC